mmetsp:Transcript_28808/g.32961  ORF Transcript_28808/g.32961 Transcript_28808/m.32961 type:complete len:81 (-) Transcript_28808:24-266(-)
MIQTVSLWRKLCNGLANPDDTEQLPAEEAAKRVGIPQKTLDDYVSLLRFGRKFGFDFNEHKDEKVAVLRAFVQKNKNKSK